jgi:hypothetical protein
MLLMKKSATVSQSVSQSVCESFSIALARIEEKSVCNIIQITRQSSVRALR